MQPRLSPWPPLPPAALVRPRRRGLPFPLDEQGCSLYALGRHALRAGVEALGLGSGDAVLVPAYHHGSEVEALRQAGLECRFYEATPSLAPDEQELLRLTGDGVRALLLVHYLGFPQDSARWRRFCDDNGLLLFEDAAQAWLATSGGVPVGSRADLAIYCLYKTYGLPDGAAAWVRSGEAAAPERNGFGGGVLARRHAAWALSRSGLLARAGARFEHAGEYDPDEDFAFGEPAPPSGSSVRAVERLATADTAAERRANYRRLLEQLGDRVHPAFAELPEGASPFAFPVETTDKPALLAALDGVGIRALDFWSVPHPSLPVDEFPRAAALRASVVGLPVHQELRPADLERMVAAVRSTAPSVASAWAALRERTQGNFALGPGWTRSWRRAFSNGPLEPVAVGGPDRLRGLLLLERVRGSLRSPTNYHTIEFAALAEDETAAAELAAAVVDLAPRSLYLQFVEASGTGIPQLIDATRAAGYAIRTRVLEHSPWIPTSGPWEEFEAKLGAKAVADLRRRRRRLEEVGEVSVDLQTGGEALDELLAEGFAVEASGWKGEQGTAIASSPVTQAFYTELAAAAVEARALQLAFLRVDGRAIAFEYNLREHGIHYRLKAGFDPAWSRYSPGRLLNYAVVADCFAGPIDRFEFLGADESYKLEWASETREMLLVQAFAPTLAGRLERIAYDHGRPLAKRVLARVGR